LTIFRSNRGAIKEESTNKKDEKEGGEEAPNSLQRGDTLLGGVLQRQGEGKKVTSKRMPSEYGRIQIRKKKYSCPCGEKREEKMHRKTPGGIGNGNYLEIVKESY